MGGRIEKKGSVNVGMQKKCTRKLREVERAKMKNEK